MKIQANQLGRSLEQNLLPVYLVSGDEPLLVQEACDAIRQRCRELDFSERSIYHAEGKFDWSQVNEDSQSLSLFAEKKLVELRIPKGKPGKEGGKAISQYLSNPPEDNILLIITPKLDGASQKSAWFKAIDKHGATIQIWPIALHDVPGWIRQRAGRMGLELDSDALHMLSEKVEGNLLAAQQELEKLNLLFHGQSLKVEHIEQSVADSAKYDVFNLCDECLKGNAQAALRMLNRLKAEGVDGNIILWALSKDIRTCNELNIAEQKNHSTDSVFRKYWMIKKRQGPMLKLARQLGLRRSLLLLQKCKSVDNTIKGLDKTRSTWDELAGIVLYLCQPENLNPAT